MIYYRKNTDPEMPLPEDFDILFFGESGGRKKPKFIGRSSFKTWLYAIGRNLAVDYIRRNAKKPKV